MATKFCVLLALAQTLAAQPPVSQPVAAEAESTTLTVSTPASQPTSQSQPASEPVASQTASKPAAARPASGPLAVRPASEPATSQPASSPTSGPSSAPTSGPASAPTSGPASAPTSGPTSAPTSLPVFYDSTLARPICPRDLLERQALERGADLRLVDRLMDERTEPPPFSRQPLPLPEPDSMIAPGVPALPDSNPFASPTPLAPKQATMFVGVSKSTFHTREPQEVLSAAQPFIDLTQRDTGVRGGAVIVKTPGEIYHGLRDERIQMQISNVFDYLLVHSWLSKSPGNGTVLLCWAAPARPFTTPLGRDLPGVPGTSIVLVVDKNSSYQTAADLRDTRLALTANFVNAPGTFLTSVLAELGNAPEQPFFSKVTLRRFSKDTVIDVLKGHADVACVDDGTLGSLVDFYGIDVRIRTVAVSPRYNLDVLYTTENNLEDYQTEIELTQRQLTTLAKDPEGQEVLFFFDEAGWYNYRPGDIRVAREHFGDFVRFITQTPVDLKPLLDPTAPVDRHTYTVIADE